MISYALYNQMAKDQVAGLTKGKDFYWEELPLQHNGKPASGAWLITRPGNILSSRKGLNLRTTIDFYVATENKIRTEVIHQAIRKYLTEHLCFCELSGSIDGITYKFTNVRVRATSTPSNEGVTPNNLIMKLASCELVYDEQEI